jgi:hypothetical protein
MRPARQRHCRAISMPRVQREQNRSYSDAWWPTATGGRHHSRTGPRLTVDGKPRLMGHRDARRRYLQPERRFGVRTPLPPKPIDYTIRFSGACSGLTYGLEDELDEPSNTDRSNYDKDPSTEQPSTLQPPTYLFMPDLVLSDLTSPDVWGL